KGEEVISERHQKDFRKLFGEKGEEAVPSESFTDVSFDDI
ncbi:MAG TPA: DNA-binding protein, partial [Flavobacterium sp.]|nr:DNA-binding protein [Flavobacterium sp.]